MKSGYITNCIYTWGTRDEHETWSGRATGKFN